uniref:Uncharacterized protein n=1 Tax=Anguilla anguilla TaxID=7936 RepID=A0A0E9R103_ANGAN
MTHRACSPLPQCYRTWINQYCQKRTF